MSCQTANYQRENGGAEFGQPQPSPKRFPLDNALPMTETMMTETILNTTDTSTEELFSCIQSLLRILKWPILAVAALAGIFIVSQTAVFLRSFNELHWGTQIILGATMIICGMVVIYNIIQLWRFWHRLNVAPNLQLLAPELGQRDYIRKDLKSQTITTLKNLLENEYTDIWLQDLRKHGMDDSALTALRRHRRELLSNSETLPAGTDGWLRNFQEQIQAPVDKLADGLITRYGIRAGMMMVVSPLPIISRLVILAACLSMLKDLLRLYALKPTRKNAVILLGKAIINTYIAGVIDDATDLLADAVAANLPDFVLRLGGKATAAGVQGYMVYRLGHAAMRVLSPLA